MVSRPSKSSIDTSFIDLTLTSPVTNWYIPGRFFSSQPVSLQMVKISRLSFAVALGIAI